MENWIVLYRLEKLLNNLKVFSSFNNHAQLCASFINDSDEIDAVRSFVQRHNDNLCIDESKSRDITRCTFFFRTTAA